MTAKRAGYPLIVALMSAAGLVQAPDAKAQGWEGIYSGVDGVWGIGGTSRMEFPRDGGAANTFAPFFDGGSLSQSPNGSGFGLHLGENRQIDNWVLGLEGGFAWTDISAKTSNAFGALTFGPTTHETKLSSLATLTPRVGYAIGNWLPYAKAGLALAEVKTSLTSRISGVQFSFDQAHYQAGWTAGVGFEYVLSRGADGAWVFGLEYNYIQFSGKTYGGRSSPDNTWPVEYSVKPSFQTLGARVSYNFGARPQGGSGGSTTGTGNWNGLYAGLDGIRGFGGTSKMEFPRDGGAADTFAPLLDGGSVSQSPNGSGFGFHLGENRQIDNWVLGLEGGFAWTDISAKTSNAFGALTFGPTTHETKLSSLATLTPRVGYAIGNWLPYAKAGLAIGEIKSSLTGRNVAPPFFPLNTPLSFHQTHYQAGWTVGVGLDYAMRTGPQSAWVFGIDYNRTQFTRKTYGGQSSPDITCPVEYSVKPTFQTLSARVSYKF